MIKNSCGQVQLFKWSIFEKYSPRLTAAVSSRDGGVSKNQYQSLNLGLHTKDINSNIIANRKIVCNALDVDFNNYTTAKQIHSNNVKLVTKEEIGLGYNKYDDAIENCDSLITNQINCTLVINIADCMAIAIYDPCNNAIGLAHAGWKGSAANIAANTINKMKEQFNSKPEDLIIGLSPAIGMCCYQVTFDVVEKFLALGLKLNDIAVKDFEEGKWRLNLAECNMKLLIKAGVSPNNIENSTICTSCNSDKFFSYRKSGGDTGRFSAFLILK